VTKTCICADLGYSSWSRLKKDWNVKCSEGPKNSSAYFMRWMRSLYNHLKTPLNIRKAFECDNMNKLMYVWWLLVMFLMGVVIGFIIA